MKKQRGIADAWLMVVAAVVVLGLIYAISHLWTSYVAKIDKDGYDRGSSTALKEVGDRDQKAIADAITERNTAQTKLDDALKKNTELQNASDIKYRQGVKDGKVQQVADIAAINAGTLVLRDPGKVAAIAGLDQAIGNTNSPPGCGPGPVAARDDGLSHEAAREVDWIYGEADRLAKKVNAEIDIVTGDRAQINH